MRLHDPLGVRPIAVEAILVATSLALEWGGVWPRENGTIFGGRKSTGRGRVQRKWVQPENVMFAQSLAHSRKIRQNPAVPNSVKVHQNPAKWSFWFAFVLHAFGLFWDLGTQTFSTPKWPFLYSKITTFSWPKRHPNTKISPRIPCLNPPFLRDFNPKILCVQPFFLFEM